jgi:hypothetical protein
MITIILIYLISVAINLVNHKNLARAIEKDDASLKIFTVDFLVKINTWSPIVNTFIALGAILQLFQDAYYIIYDAIPEIRRSIRIILYKIKKRIR